MLLNEAAYTTRRILVLFKLLISLTETPLNSEKFSKIAKIAPKLPKIGILKTDPNVAQWKCFCQHLEKF